MNHLDPTLSPALEAIYSLLDQRPAPRRYADVPSVDYHVECFKRLCERDKAVREMVQPRVEPEYERDAEEFFADEQSPSDATFR